MDLKKYANMFKAIGDETRLFILKELINAKELCACKLLEKVECNQSTLSHHMKILTDSELVVARKDWKWVHYSIDKAHNAAYELGLSKNAFTYLEIAVLLMSIITVMALSHIVNITYVVFYLCISVYLKDNFIRLMQYSDQSAEYNNQLAKLLHYMDLSIKNNPVE